VDGDQVTQVAPSPETIVEAALWVAKNLGAYVFPVDHPDLPRCIGVRTRDHDPATCDKRGKHPAVPKFSIDATNTARDIVANLAGPPRNYAVYTRRSGLLVLDVDDPQAYEAKLAELNQQHIETFEVNSHGDRRHYWYRVDRDSDVGNAQLCKGVDVRAGGIGYVIGPGSKHATGSTYTATWERRPVPAPAWLVEVLMAKQARLSDEERHAGHDQVPNEAKKLMAEVVARGERSERFHAIVGACKQAGMSAAATVTTVTPWCKRVGKYVGRVTDEVERCWPKLDGPKAPAKKSRPRPDGLFLSDGSLVVNNPAELADWLRGELGRGQLSGMFLRAGELVHTPREGEDGYIAPGERDDDGPAQIRTVDASRLASRCQYSYRCIKLVEDRSTGETKAVPGLFPQAAAKVPVDVPDLLPNVRRLRGVVHSPVLRADGSILERPGYDQQTGLLHLPEPGLIVPPVPERPSEFEVKRAVALLDEMLAGFVFATESDRCNYLGLLITPVLRTLLPPPYKLGCIGAPMPGSGKSLIASILRIVHGGVFRAEVPDDESELRKQVTTILEVTTGPVVQFDNATGILRSSTLAALLTSRDWDDRRLGANQLVRANNDRLWIVTGNNLTLGGDLVRRALWVTIDPGVPDPHLRTGFAIVDLEGWAREHRGALLHALLVLARAWLAGGAPRMLDRSDSYATWAASLRGLLAQVGVPGTFDAASTARQQVGADDSDWAQFLATLYRAFGDRAWQVGEVVAAISRGLDSNPIPVDALPQDLADKFEHGKSITRSLGKWLANREGRFADGFVVRASGEGRNGNLWRVERWEPKDKAA
jgi:Bifunctional DNA primase/polymerase, N-terminal